MVLSFGMKETVTSGKFRPLSATSGRCRSLKATSSYHRAFPVGLIYLVKDTYGVQCLTSATDEYKNHGDLTVAQAKAGFPIDALR